MPSTMKNIIQCTVNNALNWTTSSETHWTLRIPMHRPSTKKDSRTPSTEPKQPSATSSTSKRNDVHETGNGLEKTTGDATDFRMPAVRRM